MSQTVIRKELAAGECKNGYYKLLKMNAPRWPGSDGWIKMAQNVNGIEIHYNFNRFTGQIRDAKFKDKP